TREVRQRVVDEDLANGAAGCETKGVPGDGGVRADKGDGGFELIGAGRGNTEDRKKRGVGKERGDEKIQRCEQSREDVLRDHHLRARVRAKGGEDVVLSAVRQAIEEEVNEQEKETPYGVIFDRTGRGRFFGRLVQRKDGHAGCNERDDEILVQWVALPEYGEMEKHDGKELAGFCKDEGDVVDVGEGGVSKWRSE
ncbi:MAG: hypothetical protein Q9214_006165, partial [Letrouitia sp. 1 TL-2023]